MLNDALHGPACMLIKANVHVCGFLPDFEICGHLRMSMRIDASYTHASVLGEISPQRTWLILLHPGQEKHKTALIWLGSTVP